MSNKLWCPGCDSHTSALWKAVVIDGEDCPYCGLPAEAIKLVEKAQEKNVSDELTDRFVKAELRATTAEAEARDLRALLSQVRGLLSVDGAAGERQDS